MRTVSEPKGARWASPAPPLPPLPSLQTAPSSSSTSDPSPILPLNSPRSIEPASEGHDPHMPNNLYSLLNCFCFFFFLSVLPLSPLKWMDSWMDSSNPYFQSHRFESSRIATAYSSMMCRWMEIWDIRVCYVNNMMMLWICNVCLFKTVRPWDLMTYIWYILD